MTYDLFTRTTTLNHYAVVQEIFTTLLKNGYIFPKTTLGAISPSTGRTLPDRYIEGTCPICGYPSARGDQCDNCGNQLDPTDLINPRSRINGETPLFVETEHYFLDLPAFAEVLGTWLQSKSGHWRPNVLKFSLNLLDDLQPRAITRDLDWGVPVPLDGWRDRPDKRIYVWFDAVIGYLSASSSGRGGPATRTRGARGGTTPDAEAYYFMGKDNIVFHSEIWPAMLLGYAGRGAKGGSPGPLGQAQPAVRGRLQRVPDDGGQEVLLLPPGRHLRQRLPRARYDVDALRYYVAVAGPENQDTDFTWSEFVRRNNDELVATWGNLVNRAVSFAAKNFGSIPEPGDADRRRPRPARRIARVVRVGRRAPGPVAGSSRRSPRRCAPSSEANKYFSEQAPWKALKSDPERMGTVLHVALQVVDDAKTLLTPFLPRSSQAVHEMLGGTGVWAGMPRLESVDEDGGPSYPVITGRLRRHAAGSRRPMTAGTPLAVPAPAVHQARPLRDR